MCVCVYSHTYVYTCANLHNIVYDYVYCTYCTHRDISLSLSIYICDKTNPYNTLYLPTLSVTVAEAAYKPNSHALIEQNFNKCIEASALRLLEDSWPRAQGYNSGRPYPNPATLRTHASRLSGSKTHRPTPYKPKAVHLIPRLRCFY